MNIAWLGWFLRSHAADGVEDVTELGDGGWRYRRVIALPHGPALATVTTPTRTTPTDTPPAGAGFLDAQLEHLDLRDLGVSRPASPREVDDLLRGSSDFVTLVAGRLEVPPPVAGTLPLAPLRVARGVRVGGRA